MNLARADYASLSDQTLLELMISDLEMNSRFKDENGAYISAQEWDGLTFDGTCDNTLYTDLIEIWWCNSFTISGGTIHLKWIPSKVRTFCVLRNELQGTVETNLLPRSLWFFKIMSNDFCGEFDISGLPREIGKIFIGWNSFKGSLNIPALPDTVVQFSAGFNQFSGSIDLRFLPENMAFLLLNNNLLSGRFNVIRMPGKMRSMGLNDNLFSQRILEIIRPSNSDGFFIDYRNAGIAMCIDENGEEIQAQEVLPF